MQHRLDRICKYLLSQWKNCYLLRKGWWSEQAKRLLRQLVTRWTARVVQFAFPQLLHAFSQIVDHRVVVVTKI